jgi:hypothetical protein
MPATDEDEFVERMCNNCLPEAVSFYQWQDMALRTVHQHRLFRRNHVLQSATRHGNTNIA